MTDRILIVGGGAVGCAIARELAPDHDVILLDQEGIGQGASGRAAGLITIASAYGGQEEIVEHGLEAFESFDGTDGFCFHQAPSLEFPSDRGPLPDQMAEQQQAGVDVDFVPHAEASTQYQPLNVPDAGYLRYNRTGWVDPGAFTTALARSASRRGVDIETGERVTGFGVTGDEVTSVETSDGQHSVDSVVVAAGWQSPSLLDEFVELPVRPYWTQCAEFGCNVDLSEIPMGWLPDEDAYWRPTRSGTILIGGGSKLIDDAEQAPTTESEAFRNRAADIFSRIVGDTDGAHYIQGWAGVDGATPDSYPIIDSPAEVPENMVISTGFHGRGIMSAFTAGAAVRGRLTAKTPIPISQFSLDRFESRSREFDFVNVSA